MTQLSRRSLIKGLTAIFAVVTAGPVFIESTAALTKVPRVPSIMEIVEMSIKKALEQTVVKQNDYETRKEISTALVAAVRPFQNSSQIYDFQVVCDSSNNRNAIFEADLSGIHVDVYVKPVESIDFFLFSSVITEEKAYHAIGGVSNGPLLPASDRDDGLRYDGSLNTLIKTPSPLLG